VANLYQLQRGLARHLENSLYLQVDMHSACRIAEAYEDLPHDPTHPSVQRSYQTLKDEVREQFLLLQSFGYEFEAWLKDGQPYAHSRQMTADIRDKHHIWFYLGGIFPKDHLLLRGSGCNIASRELSFNDVFRVVHDTFGHAMYGNGFGPRGEEHAWRTHQLMFTRAAHAALATETRGQNCWFNFGRHVRGKSVQPADRPYAPQKNIILPADMWGLREEDCWTPSHTCDCSLSAPNAAGSFPSAHSNDVPCE
jgi:hypothetical protein